MSYEGYDQVLCERGHLSEFDCHDERWTFYPICHCGAKFVWSNPVDETNGSFDEDDPSVRIDGYVELEVLHQAAPCPHCGHTTGEPIYKIPQGVGHLVNGPRALPILPTSSPEECPEDDEDVCQEAFNDFLDKQEEEDEFGVGLLDEEEAEEECPEKEFEREQDAFYEEQRRKAQKEQEEFGVGL